MVVTEQVTAMEAMAGMPEKVVMETAETGAKEDHKEETEETEGMEMDMVMEVTEVMPEKEDKEAKEVKGALMVGMTEKMAKMDNSCLYKLL